jgi:putative ABC transport system permease protein
VLDALRLDLRHALRQLIRYPSYSVPAILVLAIGIGATVAVFSLVDHILLRPLPIPRADRVVTICERSARSSDYCSVATPNLVDWARGSRSFEAIGAARSGAMALRTAGGAVGVNVGIAMPGFLRALGAATERGRMLTGADGPPSGDGSVAVVSDEFWRSELGGDPGALGRQITLDGKPYTVVGVLRPGTMIPRLGQARLWVPLPWDPATPENRDWRGFVAAARLAPGVTPDQAQAELRSRESALAASYPEALRGWSVDVHDMRDYVVRGARPALLAFLAAVVLVLLLVCANVSGLLLSRATARQSELAVRSALGAGRGRLASQLLAESLLLSVIGGTAGALLATWGVHALRTLAPAGIPRLSEVAVDGRMLLVTAAIALASGAVAGLAPALRIGRPKLAEIFRGGRGTSMDRRTRRTRRILVTGQLALALVLVTSAGLLLRSFAGLLDWRPGFETDHLLTFGTFASQDKYPRPPEVLDLYRRIGAALRSEPGVRSVGTVSAGPLFGGGDGATPFLVAGRGWTRDQAPGVAWYDAGPGYFSTLGVPLRSGRLFEETDDTRSPTVAVINRAMADRYWPNENPVGASLALPELGGAPTVRIVGVVGDVKPFLPDRAPEPELYLSNRQRTRWATYFVIRTDGDPLLLAPAVRRILGGIDPDLEASHLGTMRSHIAAQLVEPRFEMTLVSLFAVIALLLGTIGVYGMMAYTTQARAGEIGVRIALGASPGSVVRWVLVDASRMVAAGGLLGVGGALLFARLLGGTIHGVSGHDPAAFLGAAALLGLGALAASLRPALRASRVDPMAILRSE